ncbi:MAG TPA: HEAT repeat domain-containing protein [Coriobacteriia bacterium]
MLDPEYIAPVEATVRGVASAVRALRLYPPTSPIPRQSVDAAMSSLRAFLDTQPALSLDVAREGFTCRGTALSASIGGGSELADMLRSHGVAQAVFMPGCSTDDLLGFLGVIMRAPETVHTEGGIASSLAASGVGGIRVVTVSLSVAGQAEEPADGQDVDEFFRELAADPDKLATWLAAASQGDLGTLAEGLGELVDASGDPDRFYATLAAAFEKQQTDGKDVLLGIGIGVGGGAHGDRARDIVGGMLGKLGSADVSASLNSGTYGKNMLSLSTALTKLPFGARMDEIIAEVRASLPDYGHDTKEIGFLDHMLGVRMNPTAEPALAQADPTYAQVVTATSVDPIALDAKRAEVSESVAHTAAHSVPTMLALLDQQRDFGLYVKSLDALASMVPRLIREHDLATALRVLEEIAQRESRATQPWPELTQRLRAALTRATGRETMAPLLDLLLEDASAEAGVHTVLRLADDAGKVSFVEEALARRDDRALDLAESLLGRRMIDILAASVPRVGAGQLPSIVRRLARYPDETAASGVRAALRRPEEIARAEAAEALSGTTNPAFVRDLAALLADPSPRVVTAAAHALARTRLPGTVEALAHRLEGLDVDGRDFDLGRELIGCLAKMPEPSAGQALRRLAERKALIKRGRFNEVQQLAREAVHVQAQRGAK